MVQVSEAGTDSGAGAPRSQVRLLLSTVFLSFLGYMMLNPIIAPLSREVGLAEWQIGLVISTGALTIVLTSQWWGRRSQSWGRKPVLIAALLTAMTATSLFAVLAGLGFAGVLTGPLLFGLFLVVRGLMFGLAISAVVPTVQAAITDATPTATARIKGMAGIGAAQGTAMVTGAALGGLLAGIDLMVPLVVIPVVMLAGLGAVLTMRRQPRHELVAAPARLGPFDRRVWPFLTAGISLFTALGFVQIIAGFINQDRFGLDTQATAAMTGGTLLSTGVGLVLAQSVIVPRTGWSPGLLLRVGPSVALCGFFVLMPDWGRAPMFIAMFLVGLGLGIAIPGFTAGPTLLVEKNEQGALAGLVGASNALSFVIAPTLATALYAWWPLLPILVSAGITAGALVFTLVHPRFRDERLRT